MSETKPHQFRPPLYHDDAGRSAESARAAPARERASEQKGWDAYRKWLSTVSGKSPAERAPIDNSIYSWKGYHSWADRVKQAWKPDEG
jgi:hypothetical protein